MIEFFFVGVGKCGTSWIHQYLSRRPEVSTPRLKETYFIDAGPRRRRRILDRQYGSDDGSRPLADFSNVSYWDRSNPTKILDYNPEARIVVTVRQPSKRALSHVRFLRRGGSVGGQTFAQYLAAGDAEDVVARSDYRPIIERYRAVFGPDRVLVLPLELLAADPQAYADRLCRFLDIPIRPVDETDREPVLAAQRSRLPAVTRAGRAVAAGLRRLGLLRVIAAVKNSGTAQRLLFVPDEARPEDDVTDPVLARLDADYPVLLAEIGVPAEVLGPLDRPDRSDRLDRSG